MSTPDYHAWYMPTGSIALTSAEDAFQEAQRMFLQEDTKDFRNKERLGKIKATTLDDVVQSVQLAVHRYSQDRSHSKIRRHLECLSERVHYYGTIMDVFVQQHPEYVCLAWGTMKLLVGAVVEHKKTGSVIANSLLDIADMLPRVELVSILYPTESLRRLVSSLYACIIKFLMRALNWYEQSSLKRALHAVTKPVGLYYDDILNDIASIKNKVLAEAVAGNQAEQRDMHNELIATREMVQLASNTSIGEHRDQQQMLQEIITLVRDLKIDFRSGQVIAQDERAKIYRSVCEVKSTQIFHVLSSECVIDHQASLHRSKAHRDRRRSLRSMPFWTSRELQDWNTSPKSSLFLLGVRIAERQSAQDFCTNIIQQLSQAQIVSLWLLHTPNQNHSLIDVLKSLIQQAMISASRRTGDSASTLFINRFIHATSETDYAEILADIISSLEVVYLIVQLSALETVYALSLLSSLSALVERLPREGSSALLRVLVVNWTPGLKLSYPRPSKHHASNAPLRRTPNSKKARQPLRPLQIVRIPKQ